MIIGSCTRYKMCKSKSAVNEEPSVEVETTNVEFLNVSETSSSVIGLGEIISTIILVLFIGLIVKWCCKRYNKSREQQQRNLEQTIRQNAGMQAAGPTAPIYAAQQPPVGMMPMVTFTNPGERRVNFTQPGGSHWETCK